MAEFGSTKLVALILCVVLLIASAACTEPSTPAATADTASPSMGPEDPQADPDPALTEPDIYLINPGTGAAKVFLRAPGAQTNAELSPDGERAVYESTSGGPSQIFVLEPDGTVLQLTREKGGAHDPTWSPDGSRIAFASSPREGSDVDIFVMNADGSHIRRLVGTAREDGHPDWSPDGSRIAFHSRYDNGLPGGLIWVASVRTRTLTQLTRGHLPYAAVDPAWSPDGRWIAYSRFDRSTLNGRIVRAEVWLMRPDGTRKRRIGYPARFDHLSENPSWSPDGSRIVFEHNAVVRVVDVRTGRTREFINAADSRPSWSPNGILVSLLSGPEVVPLPPNVDAKVTFTGSRCKLDVLGPIDPGALVLRFINNSELEALFMVEPLAKGQEPEDLKPYQVGPSLGGRRSEFLQPSSTRAWSSGGPVSGRWAVLCYEDQIPSPNGFFFAWQGVVGPIEVS